MKLFLIWLANLTMLFLGLSSLFADDHRARLCLDRSLHPLSYLDSHKPAGIFIEKLNKALKEASIKGSVPVGGEMTL